MDSQHAELGFLARRVTDLIELAGQHLGSAS
jgi:hypothetical protein